MPPLSPTEYFARNCWVGVSFPSPTEAMTRHVIGADRFMWGSDYPHDESTYPNTREGLRRAFAGTDPLDPLSVPPGAPPIPTLAPVARGALLLVLVLAAARALRRRERPRAP